MQTTDFLALLEGVQKRQHGYMAKCPGHDDVRPSLHISVDDRGIGLRCHAGCSNEVILNEMGLNYTDLFFDDEKPTTKRSEIVAEYNYHDERGTLLYQVVRYDDKKFRQRRPNGVGWVWDMNGVRRVPYFLPEVLQSDATIFIVEGEKDVHTLRAHGFVATTNSGGAGKWDESWTSYFDGRRVVIIPDLDEPGFEHANKIAESLRHVANVSYIRLYDAKDITEWLLTHSIAQLNELVESASPYEESLVLRPDVLKDFTWPEVPIDYGLLGEITALIEPHSEADPVGIFMELLVTFGSCIGSGPYYKIGGTYHRCNLFLALCGETGTARKGSAHDWVREIFGQIDAGFINNCMLGGLSSGEGVIHAVRDPKVNKKGEVTDEGVVDKRRVFFESELAGRTFTAMKREGNTLSSVLRQAWESTNLAVATKQNDDRATGALISIIGHATVKELLGTLRHSDIVGGFANRFLYFVVRRSKLLPIQTEPEEVALRDICIKVRKALEDARRVSRVTLAEGPATERWEEIYRELDREANNEDNAIAPFLSRGAPQILRMAMILTLADGGKEIGVPQLNCAAGLWNYCRRSVEYMMEAGLSGAFLTGDALTLFQLLEKVQRPMSSSEIRDELKWSGARIAVAKSVLVKHRIATEQQMKGTGGRPKKMISI